MPLSPGVAIAISRPDAAGGRRAAVLAASVALHVGLLGAVGLIGSRAVMPEGASPEVEMMFDPAPPDAPALEPAVPASADAAAVTPPPISTTAAPIPATAAAPPIPPIAAAPPPVAAPAPSPEIAPAVAPSTPPVPPPVPRRPAVARAAAPRHAAPVEAAPPIAAAPVVAAPAPQAPALQAPAAPAPAAISSQWQSALASWVRSRTRYPDEARLSREQGGVLVRFTVRRDGAVMDTEVVHGSGHATLDQAAATMFRSARLPPFPPEMVQAAVTVTVPVRYRLEE